MLNGRLISQIFGSLLFLEAILMAVCLPISLIYGQHDLWAFLITIAITVATGLGFRALGKGADNYMSRRDAYFVVTSAEKGDGIDDLRAIIEDAVAQEAASR